MTTITREQLHERARRKVKELEFAITQSAFTSIRDGLNEELELARIALASLEAEPIGAFHIADQQVGGTSDYIKDGEWPIDNGVIEVYAAPPASEREQIRREHAEWSDKTFGDVGPIGPLKHLSKEALEAAADPSDPLEWADMQFLLWDAQRRMGLSDEFITRAMIEKLEINKSRQWPEPKDGELRLHIKEQPVPVVPEDISGIIERFRYQADHLSDWHHIDEHSCKVNRRDLMTALEFMDSCRAAMLQGSQPVSNRDELQVIGWLRSDYNSDDKRDPNAPLFMLGRNDPSETWGVKYIPLSGNSPVIPGGWISCSERMPNDKQYVWCWGKSYGWTEYDTFEGYYDWSRNKWWTVTDDGEEPASKVTHWMPLPEPPQEVK